MNALQTYALCSALRVSGKPSSITGDPRWLERRANAVEIKAQSLDASDPAARAPEAEPPVRFAPPQGSHRLLDEIHARHNAVLGRK